MAWAGEYGDDDDDELNSTPIEEILAVTREDQVCGKQEQPGEQQTFRFLSKPIITR